MSYFKRVAALTPTTFWINNATRREARLAIEAGAVGATQNPAYLSKALASPDDGPCLIQAADEMIALEPSALLLFLRAAVPAPGVDHAWRTGLSRRPIAPRSPRIFLTP